MVLGWAAITVLAWPAEAARPLNVFILHSYSQEYPWTKRQHEGFIEALTHGEARPFQFSTEYLDTKRRRYDADYARTFKDYLRAKYGDYQPDLIYVSDDNALLFARDYLASLFPRAPVFFSGINDAALIRELDERRYTGVFEKKDIGPNLALLTHAHGAPAEIIVVGDGSNTYAAIEREVTEELRQYPKVHATYVVESSLERLLAALRQYPGGYLFLTTLGAIADADGNVLPIEATVRAIARSGQFVILTMEDVYLVDGVLGGYLTSGHRQGAIAAEAVRAYVGGTPVASIPRVWRSPNEYIFDARELAHHRFSLPDEVRKSAVILNSPPGFYQRNRLLILGALYLLIAVVLTGSVMLAVVVARKNRRIERKTRALAEVEQSMVRAQNIAKMGSWDWLIPENRLNWSPGIYTVFGISPQEWAPCYESFLKLVHPDDRDAVNTAVQSALERDAPYDIVHRIVRPDGVVRMVHEVAELQRDAAGHPIRMSGTVQDVTEKEASARALSESEASYRGLFDGVPEAIYIQDARGCFIDVNPGAARVFGRTRQDMLGKCFTDLAAPDKNELSVVVQRIERAYQGEPQTFEFWGCRANGEIFPMEVHLSRGTHFGRDVVLAVAVEITKRKQMEEDLRRLAHFDTLTGLPNRAVLLDRLEHAITSRRQERVAVLFIDLDGFKHINDSLGHAIGDQLLEQVARRLRDTVRAEDTVGRLGGDEFVVLLENITHPEQAVPVVQKLLDMLQDAHDVAGRELYISASIGLSLYPDDGESAATLLKHADAAMYRAKAAGRNTFRFYTQEITRQATERLQIESRLRAALGGEDFSLHYQPIVDLPTRAVVGAEALLRWNDSELGNVSPARFIPIAEETGLIEVIGEWVLGEACRAAKRWMDQGLVPPGMTFSVNISGKQLQRPNFVERFTAIVSASGLPPQHLVVELTEGVLAGWQEGSAVMAAIRRLGIGVAVDDFGTGYSSLSYLKLLPITKLKIDQSFVRDVPADANDAAIARAIIALGRSLQLEVVAEGIETEAQAAFLTHEGCVLGQGYLYGRPMPEAEFDRLLAREQRSVA